MGKKRKSHRGKRNEDVRARSAFAKFSSAARADARGRAVPPTIIGYETAAKAGDQQVAEALIARHNARMFNLDSIPDELRMEILSGIVPVIQLGAAARDLGADLGRHPSSMGRTWVDQLMWGVDSLVAASRLLLSGQIAGAAVIARNQIEVWTESRATISGITKLPGEKNSDFIARAWSQAVDPTRVRRGSSLSTVFDSDEQYASSSDPMISHKHVLVAGGAELCPAVVWMLLSEMLHGREFTNASAWDAACLDAEGADDVGASVDLVLSALKLSVVHLRKLLLVSAGDLGAAGTVRLLSEQMDEFSEAVEAAPYPSGRLVPPPDFVVPSISFLAPLLPDEGLSKHALALLENAANAFEGVMKGGRPAGRLYRDDELATAAFGWHRYRSATFAQKALDHELEIFGSEHDLSGLSRRGTAWIFVGEAAALLGTWLPKGNRREAAYLAASTLRSSWWLWLEDDDRAMAALRTALEQVTRLRVWRLKPEKAQALELRSTPRDWIENSGWKRLGPLNKALGEFAHLNARSNWSEARDILTNIQEESDNPEAAPFTARRAAAELVTLLIASEVREQISEYSADVAAALGRLFTEAGTTSIDEQKYLNERFNFIWSFRHSGAAARHS